MKEHLQKGEHEAANHPDFNVLNVGALRQRAGHTDKPVHKFNCIKIARKLFTKKHILKNKCNGI